MTKNTKRNLAAAFLIAAPLLGLSCASSKPKTDTPAAAAPTTAASTMADAQNQSVPATPPPAAVKKKSTAAKLVCELGSEKRTVVYKMKGTGCQVTYTKFGHSKVVAENPETTNHCDNVFDRIKKNLSDAGYACRETD